MSVGDKRHRRPGQRGERRTEQLGLRLSHQEMSLIEQAAARTGTKAAAWLIETGLAVAGENPQAMVEAVLDVLAPKADLSELGLDPVRVPIFTFEHEGHAVSPTDEQVQALAEQIVTAIRTAS